MFKIIVAILMLLMRLASAEITNKDTPDPLLPWHAWVLYGYEDRFCPIQSAIGSIEKKFICHWPTNLSMELNDRSVSFLLQVTRDKAGWVTLPGDSSNSDTWPFVVSANGVTMPIADRSNLPAIWLEPGEYLIEGKFVLKDKLKFITVPKEIPIISLKIANKLATYYREDDKLWFERNQTSQEEPAKINTQDLKIYRLVTDGIPISLNTILKINVGGLAREINLGKILPPNFKEVSTTSSLPFQLQPDGNFTLMVKPGTWEIDILARAVDRSSKIMPITERTAIMPLEEIWLFKSMPGLRQVQVAGVKAIDARKDEIPLNWNSLPAYLVKADDIFILNEVAITREVPDQLALNRAMWLDFSGKNFTVHDRITGQINNNWRLDMLPPGTLELVKINGLEQPITRLAGNTNGFEVRDGKVDIEAVSEVAITESLPIANWNRDFTAVKASIHLPPGWRVFEVLGADFAAKTWIRSWSFLDLFLVLVITIAASRIFNIWHGIVAFCTLVLIYHATNAPIVTWLNMLIILALFPVLPYSRFKQCLKYYGIISLLILVCWSLFFIIMLLRSTMYLQLEQAHNMAYGREIEALGLRETPPIAASHDLLLQKQSAEPFVGMPNNIIKFDPSLIIQTGPGVPKWSWNKLDLSFNGPVLKNSYIKLLLITPMMQRILNLLSIVLVLVFNGLLLRACKKQCII